MLDLVGRLGHRRLAEPVELSSGAMSLDFVDVKRALARGSHLALACQALLDLAGEARVEFDAVGGLTLGADPLAHGMALLADKLWFVVRKQPKGRGTDQWVEGATLRRGLRVMLVEDVVTTGASTEKAYERVVAEGTDVVLAAALVDRGESARALFDQLAVPYRALLTYADLGIDPVVGPAVPLPPNP